MAINDIVLSASTGQWRMTGKTPPAFLTTEEVLSCLKVNPRTIYRLIKTGELPAVRIGRQWRFRRSDLDTWIDRQRTAAS